MKRLLVVGSGLTASTLSFLLSRATSPHLLDLTIWDKARGCGGRMASVRSNKVEGCRVDLGAQFFSITPEYGVKHKELFDRLIAEKILEPLTAHVKNEPEYPDGTRHFIAPSGSSTVPKFFLKQSRATVEYRQQVTSIDLDSNYNSWLVSGQGQTQFEADAVVLTIPVPQVLTLKGNFQQYIDNETIENLKNVSYTPRYALGLFYEPGTDLPGDWSAMYVHNDPNVVRYISKDHLKRGRPNEPPSLMALTCSLFGLQSVDAPLSRVQTRIVKDLTALLPDFPNPVEMRLHKWRYAQVFREYPSRPGCVVVHSQPPLLLAGDGFSHTNFSGTFSSAKAAMEEIRRTIPGAFDQGL